MCAKRAKRCMQCVVYIPTELPFCIPPFVVGWLFVLLSSLSKTFIYAGSTVIVGSSRDSYVEDEENGDAEMHFFLPLRNYPGNIFLSSPFFWGKICGQTILWSSSLLPLQPISGKERKRNSAYGKLLCNSFIFFFLNIF